MAKTVCVIASTHNPRIFWNRENANEEDMAELEESFAVLRAGLAEAAPDVIIVVANDHLDNCFFAEIPSEFLQEFVNGVVDQLGMFPEHAMTRIGHHEKLRVLDLAMQVSGLLDEIAGTFGKAVLITDNDQGRGKDAVELVGYVMILPGYDMPQIRL